jgi:transcriptional repressor NrdR
VGKSAHHITIAGGGQEDAVRCPKCDHLDDKVIDSRAVRNGDAIRRRRVCLKCGHRFTTYEEVVKASIRVIKRDGRHEEFDRRKLLAGIQRACQKRPISVQQIEGVVDAIIGEVESEYEREVPSTMIGQKVMNKLEELDEVAYVRFASVYRRFRDVNQFLSEVEGLIGRE